MNAATHPTPAGAAPLVTVVMSTYREIADGRRADGTDSSLARAVRSVLAQTYTNWELVVISDHPPEDALRRISAFLDSLREPRARHHDMQERGGLTMLGSVAKHAGVERSSGPLIAFLDADNAWHPDFLARGVAAFLSDPTLDLVYFDTMVRRARAVPAFPDIDALSRISLPHYLAGPLVGAAFRWRKPDWDAQGRRLFERYNFIDSGDALFRRDCYEAVGHIPFGVLNDWHLWLSFLGIGRDRFRHIPIVGQCFATATWGHHIRLYYLTLVHRFDIPFDLRAYERATRTAQHAVYERKHDA